MKIAIIGTGYVGLVTGTCLAQVGHQVICADSNEQKVTQLKAGLMPIYEPGLEELVRGNMLAGRLAFTTSTRECVDKSDVIFIAVSTPPLPDGGVDLSYIEAVTREIASTMKSYKVVVDKSTVPIKTGEKVVETITRYCKSGAAFDVVSNPEFLREGSAVEDAMHPDRVVVGVLSQRPVATMRELYAPFKAPILVTDINSAELIKHAANSFLAMKISYINALSVICEAAGANVHEVADGIGMDRRIGRQFLDASLGFGGSCFPKDLSGFIRISEKLGYDFRLLKAVQEINHEQLERFFKKIVDTLWVVKNKRIGVLGLAFKKNTDDIRMSPAIELCRSLQKEGATLRVYDPKAMDKARAILPDVTFSSNMDEVPEGCDALVIATEWPEFKNLDLDRCRRVMTHPILFDGRNLFDPREMEKLGFVYRSIGRA
jgi:UDPglucose 6-dehydrogenase